VGGVGSAVAGGQRGRGADRRRGLFPALEQAIRAARRSVLTAGWCITPGFAIVRDEPPVLLRELLGEAAELVDVRVLLWAAST
jgi:hypothetical protein